MDDGMIIPLNNIKTEKRKNNEITNTLIKIYD